MPPTTAVQSPIHPFASRPDLRAVLDRLHAASIAQEQAADTRGAHYPKDSADRPLFEGQLVALDEDKCRAMYLILRAMGARRVVEAGTSYGVSLIWLLAAVLDNLSTYGPLPSRLPTLAFGTENEPAKAARALEHVSEAFDGALPAPLRLLEGDILQTLPAAAATGDIPDRSIDALLLDIWAPLALPTLQILLPKLRQGAVVFVDNSTSSSGRYAELLGFLREPMNGFQTTTLPHSGGFELCVYVGTEA